MQNLIWQHMYALALYIYPPVGVRPVLEILKTISEEIDLCSGFWLAVTQDLWLLSSLKKNNGLVFLLKQQIIPQILQMLDIILKFKSLGAVRFIYLYLYFFYGNNLIFVIKDT